LPGICTKLAMKIERFEDIEAWKEARRFLAEEEFSG
jgi:hypothetical protein